MTRIAILIGLLAVVLGGCTQELAGTTRGLGSVSYPAAFAAAKDVMVQYAFSIDSADPATGVIRSLPKGFEAGRDRILGGSPARKIAKITVRERGGEVVAVANVTIERQGEAESRRLLVSQQKYNSVPDETPAQVEGATTPEQNEVWHAERQDVTTERGMVEDIYQKLHPQPK